MSATAALPRRATRTPRVGRREPRAWWPATWPMLAFCALALLAGVRFSSLLANPPLLRVAGVVVANSWTAAWFEFTAYEGDFAWLKIGQTVEVSLPSAPGKTYLAQIKQRSSRPVVDTDFDMATGSTKVRAEISEPPVSAGGLGEKKLFNNLYAEGRVQVDLPERLPQGQPASPTPGGQRPNMVSA